MFRFDHIYKHAADALSQLQAPNFRDFDEDDVFDAFNYPTLVSEYSTWLSYFQQLIQSASSQQTKLVERSFYTGIKGLNRTFDLIRGDEQKRVIIAAGIPPIMVWERE